MKLHSVFQVKCDEDIVGYLADKSDEDKERLVKMSGLEIIRNDEDAIGKAFASLLPQKQRLYMKNAGIGIFSYDELVYGIKEMESHKQITVNYTCTPPSTTVNKI